MPIEPNAMAWACALKVLEDHGERAPVFIAERVGALALSGDIAGVEMWKSIASRLDQLCLPKATDMTH